MVQAAAHAARASVQRPFAGYFDTALEWSRRRNDLLHLFDNHGGAFPAHRVGLCAIWPEHHRLDELLRGAPCRRTIGDNFKAQRRHPAANLTVASCAVGRASTSGSGSADASATTFTPGIRLRRA